VDNGGGFRSGHIVAAPPLTHHEILGFVEPFARCGRRVDLAASNRVDRKLVFAPVEVAAELPSSPPLRETLELDCRDSASFRLTRTLTRADGLLATLQASGPQAGALLAQIDAVPPAQQFQSGAGFEIARSYVVAPPGTAPAEGRPGVPPLILSRGVARVDGLTLTLSLIEVRGVAGDLTLEAAPGEALDLPEDLIAVLGWDWSRLMPDQDGWKSKLRLRGKGLRRTRTAEAALEKAARHLAQVVAEAPARFHQRHVRARWGVVFRRAIPSLTALGLVLATLVLTRGPGSKNAGLFLALHYVPIAVLALGFSLQEQARFEIPPWPRGSKASTWRLPPPAPAGSGEPSAPRVQST
jgi:hypothetical protein